jgi:bacterioferritin
MAMVTTSRNHDVSRADTATRAEVIELLTDAYLMELETVMNYLAASTNLDGLHGRQVAELLSREVEDELGHARRFAERIKELGGTVPGSEQFAPVQRTLQPPADSTDAEGVIRGVIDAERAAIAAYSELARIADGADYVTHDLAVEVLADEEGHLRLFQGLLRELESRSA